MVFTPWLHKGSLKQGLSLHLNLFLNFLPQQHSRTLSGMTNVSYQQSPRVCTAHTFSTGQTEFTSGLTFAFISITLTTLWPATMGWWAWLEVRNVRRKHGLILWQIKGTEIGKRYSLQAKKGTTFWSTMLRTSSNSSVAPLKLGCKMRVSESNIALTWPTHWLRMKNLFTNWMLQFQLSC